MASGDVMAVFQPRDFFSGSGPNTQFFGRADGVYEGLPLGKGYGGGSFGATAQGDTWYCIFRAWVNGTPLGTGITCSLLWTDDPGNSGSGLVAVVGVSGGKLVSGTTDLNALTWGTETTVSLTAPTTATKVTATTAAITTANLNTPAAGNYIALRVRRLPTNSSDTHTGRLLLVGMTVTDT